MGNNLTTIIFDESVRHAVKQRILSQQGMKREKISSDQVTRGCIAQVGSYSESAFVELIPQHVVGELIHRGNHKNAQNQHNGGIRAANFPLEANPARFLIHFVSLVNSVQSFECDDF